MIKLVGAIVVVWGAWRLTQERVPALGRVMARILVMIAMGGHVARLLFALADVPALAAEPLTMLVDALAVSACALCVATVLRAGPTRRRALGATLLAGVYFAVAASSALLRFATETGAQVNSGPPVPLRGAISLTMAALSVWAAVAVARLPRE